MAVTAGWYALAMPTRVAVHGAVRVVSAWGFGYTPALAAPVAQLDRAPDYGSGGWEFESSRARQSLRQLIHSQNNTAGNASSPSRAPGCSRACTAGSILQARSSRPGPSRLERRRRPVGKGRPTGAAPRFSRIRSAGRASQWQTGERQPRPRSKFQSCSQNMAAAALTSRRRRTNIVVTPLAELDGMAPVIDCLTPDDERRVLVRDLSDVYGRRQTLADALQRMRCAAVRRGPGRLGAGKTRGERPRRAVLVALMGPDAVG